MSPEQVRAAERLAATCRDPGNSEAFADGADRRPRPFDPALAPVLAEAVHASRASIMITDADLDRPGPRIVYVNPAFEAMTGWSAEAVIEGDPRVLQGPATARAVLDRLRRDLTSSGRFEGEAVNHRADGSPFVMSWRIAGVTEPDGRPTHYVAIQDDVTTDRLRAHDADVLVTELQRMLLPQAPAALGPLRVAARFRPASAGFPVGGDWYDTIERPDDSGALVVGDVAGSGAEAVAAMTALRWTVHSLLAAGHPLDDVVRAAGRTAHEHGWHATLAIAVVRGAIEGCGGTAEIVTAGHPPVVLLRGGAGRALLTRNPMLGITGGDTTDGVAIERVGLAPGDSLVLVTDGVLDGGRIDVDDVPRCIAERAATVDDAGDPQSIASAVVDGSEPGDDAVVLVAAC